MKPNRSAKPAPQGKLEINLPAVEKLKIDGDVPFYFVRKNDLPIVNLRLIFRAGSKADPVGKTGLTYMTSMLLDEGAAGLSTFEIDAGFENLGTGFSISTTQDAVYISLLSLNENLEKSLELLGKIVNSPDFTDESFGIEKHKLHPRRILRVYSVLSENY